MARTNNRLSNQGLWIGAGFGSMDDTSLYMPGQLGMVVVKNDKAYQLVQFDSSTSTVSAGAACAWIDVDDFVVTTDISDTNRNLPAGVALGTQTASSYGWIQVDGPASVYFAQGSTVAAGGTDAAAGETAIMSATDLGVDRVAAGTASTYQPLGIFMGAATGGTTPTSNFTLRVAHNGW